MKQISFWATIFAMIVCGITITSCSKDDDKESGGEKEKVSNLDDYVDKYCIRCERVGANLIVEVVFENITDNAINDALLKLKDGKITDNIGNVYYVDAGGATNAYLTNTTDINTIPNYSNKWTSMNIPAKGYAVYFIKILNFDPSNKATQLSFDLTFSSSSLPADSYDITAHGFIITDNRVMENGIQTNDTALVYKVLNCERVGSVLQIDFSITNNSAIEIGNLTLNTYDNAIDNLGNSYYYIHNLGIAIEEGYYKSECKTRVKPGATVSGRIRVIGFDNTNKANTVSVPIRCKSDTYNLTDNVVRFITIPIKDNRVLYDGIQTPDLKISVKLAETQIRDNGDLIVNYTITNNTGDALKNFAISPIMSPMDDLSNEYYYIHNVFVSMNECDFFNSKVTATIANGSTVNAAVGIKGFSAKAKNVTFDLGVSSDNYEFADNKIHFITIPIQK